MSYNNGRRTYDRRMLLNEQIGRLRANQAFLEEQRQREAEDAPTEFNYDGNTPDELNETPEEYSGGYETSESVENDDADMSRAPTRSRLLYAPNRRPQLAVASPPVHSTIASTSRLFYDEEMAIENEREVRPGNVSVRPEFNFEEASSEPVRAPASLYECITNGVLDMNKASRLILRQKRDGSF
ncbi:unnamed protein product, partial [Strongylus vulgaris]